MAAIVIGIGAVVIVRVDGVAPVVGAQVLIGLASVVISPAIAAISLGLVGRPGFARRAGRNEAFNHAGNWGRNSLYSRSQLSRSACNWSMPE